MVRITPCRNLISDRFSVASFVVQVPPERMFEVACATDPALFRADQRHRRTAQNFATSRASGLLRAPAGQATYVVPAEQLRRFAGQTRIYYAVGCYRGPGGEGAEFSVAPDAPEAAPYIQLSSDFTGKTLDRSRLRGVPVDARYGDGAPAQLGWGGDLVAQKQRPQPTARVGTAEPIEYDDGFDNDLWQQPAPTHGGAEPDGCEDAPDLRRRGGARPLTLAGAIDEVNEVNEVDEPDRDGRYGRPAQRTGEPAGFEDAVALHRSHPTFGRPTIPATHAEVREVPHFGGREPEGFEDGRALRLGRRAYGGRCSACDDTGKVPCTKCSGRGCDACNYDGKAPCSACSTATSPGEAACAGKASEDPPKITTHPSAPSEPNVVTFPDKPKPADNTTTERVGGPRPYARYVADFDDMSEETAPPARPLTPADRVRILDGVFATLYGSNLYDHVEVDDDAGLVWGAAGFAQAHGTLGEALAIAQRRDPAAFLEIFGDGADELLQVTRARTPEARLAPVAGRPLGDPRWQDRFRAAGRHTPFCAAQREAADALFFQPALPFARQLGLETEPQLAVLFDRCAHMGAAGGCRYLLDQAWPRLGRGELTSLRARFGMASSERLDPLTVAAIHGERARRGEGPDATAAFATLLRGPHSPDPDIARRVVRVHQSDRFNQGQRYTV